MSRIVFVLAVLALATAIGVPPASAGAGNGNAYNFNWLRDFDGDGIPNGLDEDWFRPLDGTGYQLKHGFGLLFTGFSWGDSEDGKIYSYQYRHRKNQHEGAGDCTRDRKQLRDGTCK
jgi:hypothetical protein